MGVLEALLLHSSIALSSNGVPGGWQCCWGIQTCAEQSPGSCPAALQDQCYTPALCLGHCTALGSDNSSVRWCEGSSSSAVPSSHDAPLLQRFRPPRQTPAQAAVYHAIETKAETLSAAARPWVLDYMGSHTVRSQLDPSLQKYSNEELLHMLTWEFERLPIFHNAPVDGTYSRPAALQSASPATLIACEMPWPFVPAHAMEVWRSLGRRSTRLRRRIAGRHTAECIAGEWEHPAAVSTVRARGKLRRCPVLVRAYVH